MRSCFEELVQLRDKITASFPNSRQRSLVLTKIEEAEMWADRMGQPTPGKELDASGA